MSINITKVSEAMAFASMKHIGQVRKSTGVAYISHPSAVSMILFDMKADTDTIIAGLLHDTVEDTDTTLEEIIEKFGQNVANLVDGVSEDKTKTWEERKQHTIDSLLIQNTPIQFITFADKLHNLQSLLDEYSKNGDDMWSAFKRGRDKQEWYYRGLLEKFGETSIPKHSYDLFKSLVNKLFSVSKNTAKERVRNSLHDTIYTRPAYPNKGNASILASNLILSQYGIEDIEYIYDLAKVIEKNSTYDHEISNRDLDIIYEKVRVIIEYKSMESIID